MRDASRRMFCVASLATAASFASPGSGIYGQALSSGGIRPDVAAIDHDRILTMADVAMGQPVQPIISIPAKRSPGTANDYYSEPEDYFPAGATDATSQAPWVRRGNTINSDAFAAHRDLVYSLGRSVAALTAAFVVTREDRYAARASEHLRAWFIAPGTRMTPNLQFARRIPGMPAGKPEGLIETVPLAEVARSVRFLGNSNALTPADLTAIHNWFREYAAWMNESRMGGLARDMKDQHGSSWLFQSAAYADANVVGLTSDDTTLSALRHRFRTATLRAEMNGNGIFPHVVSSPNPYRDCLFNLDLLCLACELMTTRFDNPWEFELQDGPGLRAAVAFHYPAIANRAVWQYPADLAHFKDLPGRRISLLLAGRAYRHPEYVDLWRTLQPLPEIAAPEVLRSFAVTQPVLWFTPPKLVAAPA
jgi:hypothetical protein